MVRPDSPCKGCEKRAMKCHSSCALYIEYRAQLDAFNEKVRKQKEDYSERNNSARRFRI